MKHASTRRPAHAGLRRPVASPVRSQIQMPDGPVRSGRRPPRESCCKVPLPAALIPSN